MSNGPNIPGHSDRPVEDVSELFYNDRLAADYVSVEDYPARINQAAIDYFNGIMIGQSSYERGSGLPRGGLITNVDFDRATGEFYREGLTAIASEHSNIHRNVDQYEDEEIGSLAFRLNEVEYELQRLNNNRSGAVDIDDLIYVIEAIVKKVQTRSMREADAAVVGQSLRDPQTVTDLLQQLLSDPSLEEYADELISLVNDSPGGQELLRILDAPEMVTPLWDHQRSALEEWLNSGMEGYVDMATATGKTVLGLAAIAVQYGALHPVDESEIDVDVEKYRQGDEASILIVAGQEVILEQWRSEFDEHFDVPRERTQLDDSEERERIVLSWGSVEFTTAPGLLTQEKIDQYDLVILDEAHQYTRGSRSGRGWGAVFEDLVDSADAILAMSGSVDHGWTGDQAAKNALEEYLTKCQEFSVPEARQAGVIADFSWEIRYTAAADSKSQTDLVERTQTLAVPYDEDAHKFDLHEIDPDLDDDDRTVFETLTDLRSFGRSKDGKSLRDRSDAFDELVTAALARKPHRWQLSPPESAVADLVAEHAPEDKVVVLVQSYPQAEAVADQITDRLDEELVVVPESGGEKQYESVQQFNDEGCRVIVGPGDVLGTGIDMPEADTAINVSKGGVSASLIQRIGRILRNPGGTKDAKFYQIVSLPSTEEAFLFGEDGRRRLRRSAEFRALGTRLRELPNYTVNERSINRLLVRLEDSGVDALEADHRTDKQIVGDEIAREHLSELVEAISRRGQSREVATVLTEWNSETLSFDSSSMSEEESSEPSVETGQIDSGQELSGVEVNVDYQEDDSGERESDSPEPGEQADSSTTEVEATGVQETELNDEESQPTSHEKTTAEPKSTGYESGGDTLFGDTPEGDETELDEGEHSAETGDESEPKEHFGVSPESESHEEERREAESVTGTDNEEQASKPEQGPPTEINTEQERDRQERQRTTGGDEEDHSRQNAGVGSSTTSTQESDQKSDEDNGGLLSRIREKISTLFR